MSSLFWLAPVLPLAAFVLLVSGLARLGRLAVALAIAAIAGAAIVSGFSLLAAAEGTTASVSVRWMAVGGRRLSLALWLDPLGALVSTLVSGIALVVFIYAASYMARDPRRGRFFTIFSLFASAMLALVLAADLLTFFIAWELVGLCSYLLIGFWFERPSVPAAAFKAFLTTRLADQAMLGGVLLLVGAAGSGRIDTILAAASGGGMTPGLLLASTLLLFTGAAGKSAQVPFHGWLPDAMAGPTPVSALLHSATMVAAGVFLVARLHLLFAIAQSTLPVVAWVGVTTALLGGLAALVETDLKRTLAYSTMSQLGLMFVGLGAGSLLAGVLLLVAQALYKATLFMAAGAIDHAVHGTDFARMGGLARQMPLVCVAFALSAAALAGLPVTLALPPKDPVLAAAWHTNLPLFWAALLASFLTALYSARTFGLVFLGGAPLPARQARPSEPALLIPLLALAALIPIGLLADARVVGEPLSELLGAATPEAGSATVLALGVAFLGAALGLAARLAWPSAVVWPWLRPLAPLLAGEFGLRALYRAVPRWGLALAHGLSAFDRRVLDPLGASVAQTVLRVVHGAGRLDRAVLDRLGTSVARAGLGAARGVGQLDRAVFDDAATGIAAATIVLVRASGRFDLRQLDAAFDALGQGLLAAGQRLRPMQTGRIENYLLAIFVWVGGAIALAALVFVLR